MNAKEIQNKIISQLKPFCTPVIPVLIILLFILPSPVESRKLFYKEEFYRIYYLPLLYANDDLTRTTRWLELAEKAPFAPPIQALAPHENEDDYKRYQQLLNLHIHYLLARNTLYMAARFDKHRPVYFNLPYKEDILKSLDIANFLYNNATIYWETMRKEFETARKTKGRSNLPFLEKLMDKILLKEVDFGRTISRKKKNLAATRAYFESNGATEQKNALTEPVPPLNTMR